MTTPAWGRMQLIALRAIPAIESAVYSGNSTSTTDLHFQARVTDMEGGWNWGPPTYEYTMVGQLKAFVALALGTSVQFGLIKDSSNTIRFFYDSTPNSNADSGTGFIDGLEIAMAEITSFRAVITREGNTLEQTDPLTSIKGSVLATIQAQVASWNEHFFDFPVAVNNSVDLTLFTPRQALDHRSRHSAAQIEIVGGSPVIPHFGAINGLSGPDILLHTNYQLEFASRGAVGFTSFNDRLRAMFAEDFRKENEAYLQRLQRGVPKDRSWVTHTLTIMFIDMVGSSSLAVRTPRQQLMRLLESLRLVIEPIVKTHGGHLVKELGDGYLVRFDSATEAIHAGTAIQRALAEYNLASRPTAPLAYRIGLDTGDVMVTRNDVIGEAATLAFRIQEEAIPGEVYFTDATRLAMKSVEVEFEEAGQLTVSHLPNPIQLYRVKDLRQK